MDVSPVVFPLTFEYVSLEITGCLLGVPRFSEGYGDGLAGFGIQEQDFPVETVSEYYRAAPPRGGSEPFPRSAPFHNGRESRDSVPLRQAGFVAAPPRGRSEPFPHSAPFHTGRESRNSVPLWQAGFVAAPPRGRSEPFSRSAPFHNGRESRDSVPLWQAVVVRPVSVLPWFSPPAGMSTGRQNVSDRKELSMRRGTIRRAKIRTPRRGQWDAFGRLAQ